MTIKLDKDTFFYLFNKNLLKKDTDNYKGEYYLLSEPDGERVYIYHELS